MPSINIGNTSQQRVVNFSGSLNSNGNNNVIPAPGAGYEIVISMYCIQNTTTTPTTFKLQTAGSPFLTVLAQNQGDGVCVQKPANREIRCGNNNAVTLNLSGANAHNCNIDYWIDTAI